VTQAYAGRAGRLCVFDPLAFMQFLFRIHLGQNCGSFARHAFKLSWGEC
jgi:hypothetical protein